MKTNYRRFKTKWTGGHLLGALLFCLLFCQFTQAQTYNMSTGTINTCSGTFLDVGGAGNYGNNTNLTQTITSTSGNRVRLDFASFDTEGGYDFLNVYDGPNTTYPLIQRLTGTPTVPFNVESSGASLTLVFTSDAGTVRAGWSSTISCTTAPLSTYNMSSGTVTACSGMFYDNAGPTANYVNNENRSMTFCSGTSDKMEFTLNSWCTYLEAGDTLFAFDGANTSSPRIAAFVKNSNFEKLTSTGTCMTFLFKSDGGSVSMGWVASFQCVSAAPSLVTYVHSPGIRYTCSGTFLDVAGTGNYGNNTDLSETFVSSNGNRLKFNFTAFVTETNRDFLYVYDGPNTTYPLIATFNGAPSVPFNIESSGSSITMRFVSDANNVGSGWTGDISCTTAPLASYNLTSGTVTACSGNFYDNAGPNANYVNNENRSMTFCSGTSDRLEFTFNSLSTYLEVGDTLFAYDGATTSSTPIAAFVKNSLYEKLTSTGTCMTFQFKSNASTVSMGWAASFQCVSAAPSLVTYVHSPGIRYNCSGTFMDVGGTGNYGNNTDVTETFVSSNGNRLKFNFTAFLTETNYDLLYVYDGPNTTYPLIRIYSGALSVPFNVESSGTSLTFRFVSDAANVGSGWTGDISCTTAPVASYNLTSGTVTACSGNFYDNAGPSANYVNNENRSMTFCSGTSDKLEFTFNSLSTYLEAGDTLFAFDGPTTSSSPIAVFVKNSNYEKLTSTGTCMTFLFKSNASTVSMGWAASFQCVSAAPALVTYVHSPGIRYTCSGNFLDVAGTGNYGNNTDISQTFVSSNGNRLKFNFTAFNTENGGDFLYVYDGPNTSYPLIRAYTGAPAVPFNVESSGTSLTFRFVSDANNVGSGFNGDISCTTAPIPSYNLTSGTVTACVGNFYDNAGPTANYVNNENRSMTFCSGTSDRLEFTFNSLSTYLEAGDTLFAFDGASTSANPMAAFVKNSLYEKLTSTGTCMTFLFKSNATTVSMGWTAAFQCVSVAPAPTVYIQSPGIRNACSGTFMDVGGAGNYGNNTNLSQTFTSPTGSRIKFDFSAFDLENGYDYLYVYDGPNETYPLIRSLTGTLSAFSIESSGTSLTYKFVSDAATVKAGWSASISCTTAPLTVYNMSSGTVTACSGMFFDNDGVLTNYPHNENRVMTFCSGTSDMLEFTFNSNATALEANDSLFVYDGSSVSANLIAVFVKGSIFEKITSSGTCLTFKFKSDATLNAIGWAASFQCVSTPAAATDFSISAGIRYTCGGTFSDGAGNYNDNIDYQQTFVSNSGCGIRFTFSSFVLHASDNLKVYDGFNTSGTLLGTYTGTQSSLVVQSTGQALTFVFTTNSGGTSAAGWMASISCPVTTPDPAPTSNSPVCTGNNINLMAGNVAGATFQWTGPNSFTSTSQNPVITNASLIHAGTYNVVALIGTCSSSQKTVTVAVNTTPSAPTTGNNGPLCEASTINLTASTVSGATYSWTGPNSFTSSSQNPSITNATLAKAGTYTVTATVNGCPASATTTVSVDAAIVATASSNSPVCLGDDINLSATNVAGAGYSWSGPNGFTSLVRQPVITASTAAASGTYSVTVTKGTCSLTTTTAVSVVTIPAIVASSNGPICAGSNLTLGATTVSGATYSWTGPNSFTSSSQNPVISNATTAASGTYNVTVSIGSCSNAGTVSVTVSPSIGTVTASNNGAVCAGSNLDLSVTTVSGASYSWTGPNSFTSASQNPTITAATTAASGTYTVVVNAGSCSVTKTTSATVNAVPGAVTASSNGPVCEGNPLNLSVTSVSGASYSWSGPNGFTSSVRQPSISSPVLADAGSYTATVSIGTCSSTSSVSVVISASLGTITASNNGALCAGSNLDLSVTAVSGATYSWSGPNSFTSASQNPTITSATTAASGIYTVVVNAGSCSVTKTTSATVNAVPGAVTATSNGPVCEGSSLNLSVTSVSGASYSWSGPNGFTSSVRQPSIASPVVADAGSYTATVSIGTCSSTSPVNVVVNAAPGTVTASSNSSVCIGSDLNLSVTSVSGATYSWTGPNGFTSASQNPSVISATSAASGTYNVTVSIGTCTSASSTNALVSAAPGTVTASGNSPVCLNDAINLSVTSVSGADYSWSGPNSFTSAVREPVIFGANATTAGTYTATVSIGTCTSTSAVTIAVNPPASIPLITANISSMTLTSSETTGNQWYLDGNILIGENNQVLNFFAPGSYTVVTTNGNGCSASSTPYVYVITGIESGVTSGVYVHPNPSEGVFKVKADYISGDEVTLTLLDTYGTAVHTEKVPVSANSINWSVNAANITKGMYVLRISSSKEEKLVKVVIE